MAATGRTNILKLGVYRGEDTVDMFATFNANMETIDDNAGNVNASINDANNKIEANERGIQSLTEKIENDLTPRVEAIESKVPGYDDNLTVVSGLVSQVNTNKLNISSLETQVNANTTNINNVTTQVTNIDAKLPFALATAGEGEDKQYGYTNDAGTFVPFDITKYTNGIIIHCTSTSSQTNYTYQVPDTLPGDTMIVICTRSSSTPTVRGQYDTTHVIEPIITNNNNNNHLHIFKVGEGVNTRVKTIYVAINGSSSIIGNMSINLIGGNNLS